MNRAVLAWGFGALFYNVTTNAVFAAFARKIGANDFVFGVLSAALPLMSLLQLLAARVVEHTGQRKRQVIVAGVVSRVLWLSAALLPLVSVRFPELVPNSLVLPLVMGSIVLAGACQAFSLPAFFAWVSDAVPRRLRAPFFARRMQVGTSVAVVIMLVSGMVADRIPTLNGYAIILAITAALGMIEFILFLDLRERQSGPATPEANVDSAIAESSFALAIRDVAVRRYLVFTSLMFFGYGSLGAFLWLHAMEYLKLSKTMGGFIFIASMLAQAGASRFWGGVIRQYGARPVLRFTSAALTTIPLFWIFAPGPQWGPWLPWCFLTAAMFYSGIVYSGYDLCNFNAITTLSPHIPRATMAALFAIVSDLSMVIASWYSGALSQALKGWHCEVLGMTFINYHVVFLCSFAVRVVGSMIVAPGLREPNSRGTRETVRAVVPEVGRAFVDLWARSWAWLR